MRVGSASSSRISSSRVALLGTITRAARRSEVLIARAEERAAGLVVVLRLGEERRVVHGDRDRAAGAQRAGVERRVQHLGADLLGEQRQAGLLPGQPGRAVRQRPPARRAPRRPAATARVTLHVGALAHHREVDAEPVTLPSAPSSPSTYRPTPPRSAGTLVASTSTRGGRPGVTGRLLMARAGGTALWETTLSQAYADTGVHRCPRRDPVDQIRPTVIPAACQLAGYRHVTWVPNRTEPRPRRTIGLPSVRRRQTARSARPSPSYWPGTGTSPGCAERPRRLSPDDGTGACAGDHAAGSTAPSPS